MTSSYMQPAAEFPDGIYSTQQHGGECRWIERKREEMLALLASESPPEFRTIHAITKRDEDGGPTHYAGPFNVDIDGESIEEAIAAFRKFLGKLQGLRLDLDMVRFFATGGRGFHAEIQQACVFPKVPAEGVADLPKLYRALALELYVDCMDMRVYSCGRGRMWRTPNVQRENSAFKVPLTREEALAMTPSLYAELCSAPRPHPELTPACYAPALGTLFAKARDAVAIKAKRTPGKVAKALQNRFRDCLKVPLPPSLLALGSGAFPAREGAGFNLVALQFCCAAHALGTSEDDLVKLCSGLIANHDSDGRRYNTPRKREAELRRMFAYTENAPYEVSIGGIRSILPRSVPANDLRGL